MIIEWDFRDGSLDDRNGHGLRLVPAGGVAAQVVDGVGALRFDGTGYLRIPEAEVGPLDVANAGDRVSVVALVRRETRSTGFIAGMWQEHDRDPRRQYGLFTSLPVYGGDQQVCGHVSADGRPSPGLPYSRDYAATEQPVCLGSWHVVAFDYDGAAITAYLDGIADPRPSYTEPGPPLGASLSYAKNPYCYPLGLNGRSRSDFTIGGVLLTAGMGNFFIGAIARVLVTPDALGPERMRKIAESWRP